MTTDPITEAVRKIAGKMCDQCIVDWCDEDRAAQLIAEALRDEGARAAEARVKALENEITILRQGYSNAVHQMRGVHDAQITKHEVDLLLEHFISEHSRRLAHQSAVNSGGPK